MKTSSTMVFLGTSALTAALLLGSAGIQGCRSDDSGGFGGHSTGVTTGNGGGAMDGGAAVVSIQQVTDPGATGHVGPKTPIKVQGAIAMSIKFLVSKGSSGSCLWGVFLSSPNLTETTPNSGVLAVSFGSPAVAKGGGTAYCPTIEANEPAGDAFPDDVKPGDILDVVGQADTYIPATCTSADAGLGASMISGIQISKVTQVTRTGSGAPLPKPHRLNGSDLQTLAAGNDVNWLDQWGNVLVEADTVVARDQGGALTDKYGHMLLDEGVNGIQVGDKVYYVGYVKANDVCYAGPYYAWTPTDAGLPFNSITGFVYLDYCNWSIAPRNKCFDLNPPSQDCASVVETDAGTDDAGDAGGDAGDAGPNPGMVCLH
jgi:hypothetical protein